MQTKPDIRTTTTLHDAKGAVACCPYCGRAIRETQRLSYPPGAVGAFATVYRCGCGKHLGAPIEKEV